LHFLTIAILADEGVALAETSRPIHKSRVARIHIQWEKVVGFFAAIVILYLIGVPMGMLVFSSFRDTREKLPIEPTDFTFQNYVQVFTSEMTYRLFRDTLVFALGSLCVGFVLAMLFAWFLEQIGRASCRERV
jgi:ABC-type spermidine/putrescine transport system permease subunit II